MNGLHSITEISERIDKLETRISENEDLANLTCDQLRNLEIDYKLGDLQAETKAVEIIKRQIDDLHTKCMTLSGFAVALSITSMILTLIQILIK